MQLSEINIYPIKSTKGIALQSAQVGRRGIEFDRRWMLVDESGKFISQREVPRFLSSHLGGKKMHRGESDPGRQSLTIPQD